MNNIQNINKKNFYWPIYQSLENELLNINNYIRFEDKQLNVYSDMLLNLLLRISIEIESISKELYLNNGGTELDNEADMYFDTICLDYLESKWELSKKIIQIVNPNMYFSMQNSILTPLKKANKRGTSGSKWKKAYQAIKHNRAKNYTAGNLENCINGLGALFILNIYYKNNTYHFNSVTETNNFDLSQGSKIFAINISKGTNFDGNFDKDSASIYFINYTEDFIKKAKQNNTELNKNLFELMLNDAQVIESIKSKTINIQDISDSTKISKIIGWEKFKEYITISVRKSNMNTLLSNQTFNAYLNKETVDN